MRTKERNGGVYVTFKSGVVPDVPKALDAIANAGSFKPRADDVFFTVTGTVASENGQFVLTLDNVKTPTKFVLLAWETSDGAAAFAKVKEFAAQSAAVELEGQWLPHTEPSDKKSPPALKVQRVAAAKGK
ncbi:MAG: hypothetical protein NZT92_07375 [Abditibacteriales bacterium]|nr:hypothetical protein [Abditibacteriales bacterium]MDW8364676.1 hypothetical protein [Abditibacteriales bacterium]